MVTYDGASYLCLAAPEVPGFGFKQLELRPEKKRNSVETRLKATTRGLESPFYRLSIDPQTGGIASLIHKPTGRELVVRGKGRTLGQTVFYDGREHVLTETQSQILALGPVVAILRTKGSVAGIEVSIFIAVYADLDQVDLSVTVKKPTSTQQQRLCQTFPVLREGMTLSRCYARRRGSAETASGRGSHARSRCATFRRAGVHRRVGQRLRHHHRSATPSRCGSILSRSRSRRWGTTRTTKRYPGTKTARGSFRSPMRFTLMPANITSPTRMPGVGGAAQPLIAMVGCLRDVSRLRIIVDPARAIATCLKPADGPEPEGVILRLQEVGGKSGPLAIGVEGCTKAMQTDLLERDLKPLPIEGGGSNST